MKNKLFFLIFIPWFISSQVYIRNGLSGGRFGDNLISYMHAKWIAYKYNLPFVYKDFIYSDQLLIAEKDQKDVYTPSIRINKKNIHDVFRALELDTFNNDNDYTIIEIPYFPEDLSEHKGPDDYIYFQVDWKDPKFKEYLRELVAPKKELQLLKLPKDKISVAIHLRLGGSFSNDRVNREKIPLKLPPLKFYVKSLEKIMKIFNNSRDLYVFIFTDENDTQYYLDYFRRKFPQKNITFDCRLYGNTHDQNVLEDFFSMVKFDCLIHPLSNYSITAAKIADYLVEIEPLEFTKKDNKFVITKDRIIISDKLKEVIS